MRDTHIGGHLLNGGSPIFFVDFTRQNVPQACNYLVDPYSPVPS
jgi:hypothetical protein